MRHRSLGSSGLLVSVVGLGCNNFGRRLDVNGTRAVVDAAIDAGITLFDTADTYGGDGASETLLGEVLGTRRSQIVHTPDPVTPIDETIAALDELITEGKIRYAGHSNFSGWQLADAERVAREGGRNRFISAQNHWSLLERDAEAEVVPAARHFGVAVLPYFPLANGLLTGKIRRGQQAPSGTRLAGRPDYVTDEKLDRVEALIAWAEAQGASILDVAIGGLAAQPGCSSVIAGAMSPEQVKANVVAGDWTPTPAQVAELDAIVPPPAQDD